MLKLTQDEMREFYHNGKSFIWQYKTLYQIHYGINSGYSLQVILRKPKSDAVGVTLKGRFIAMTKDYATQFIN